MKKSLLFSFTLVVAFTFNASFAQATYYWIDGYNGASPDFYTFDEYIPEDTTVMIIDVSDWDFIQTVKASEMCEEKYDDLKEDLQEAQNNFHTYIVGAREEAFEKWLDNAQVCLDKEVKEAEETEANRIAKLRAEEVARAAEECDFEVMATFTNDEKRATYDERMACEAVANEPDPEPAPVVIEPVAVSEPVITEPVVTQYVPPSTPVKVTEVAEEEPEPAQAEEVTPTTTEEKIEVTKEELDKMVEEKMNEKLNEPLSEPEPEPAPKPSFFKRVVNFLFGWMF